jgi:hypothetical protein
MSRGICADGVTSNVLLEMVRVLQLGPRLFLQNTLPRVILEHRVLGSVLLITVYRYLVDALRAATTGPQGETYTSECLVIAFVIDLLFGFRFPHVMSWCAEVIIVFSGW